MQETGHTLEAEARGHSGTIDPAAQGPLPRITVPETEWNPSLCNLFNRAGRKLGRG